MRQPPPVGVTCSGGGAWRTAQTMLVALAALVFVAWGVLLLGASPTIALVAAALAGAVAGGAVWRLSPPHPVRLEWDGAVWSADGRPGGVTVMFDLGAWMLVRFRAQSGSLVQWLPLPDREVGVARHVLRAALFSPAASAGPAAGSPRQGSG
jgi:hypothetical protein